MRKNNDYKINIMMMGGRRCGKTTVLASMQQCFDKKFGSSNLTITIPDSGTLIDFENKMKEIDDYYHFDRADIFAPDYKPSLELKTYQMGLSLKSKSNGEINMNFTDFPGGWISMKENAKSLEKSMADSHVIIIAIDTPHLMEHTKSDDPDTVGMFNEASNRSHLVSNLIKRHLSLDNSTKMILFVPLKCERYRRNGTMSTVIRKIKTAYRPLIDHINNEHNREKCVMAITPIYTFGTVEFKRFKRSDAGKILVSPETRLPRYPLYGFTDDAGNMPEPLYCDMPLIYTLMYVLTIAKETKEKAHKRAPWFIKGMRKLGEGFLKFPSADDFLMEINGLYSELSKVMNNNSEGFELITNPLQWK